MASEAMVMSSFFPVSYGFLVKYQTISIDIAKYTLTPLAQFQTKYRILVKNIRLVKGRRSCPQYITRVLHLRNQFVMFSDATHAVPISWNSMASQE